MPVGPPYYLQPEAKWLPLYAPPKSWQVITIESIIANELPKPPDGVKVYWWLLPKNQWPYRAPFEKKTFGAWPASKVSMWQKNYSRWPEFGVIKVKMDGQKIDAGKQISFLNMKIHMRHLNISQLKVAAVNVGNLVKYYSKESLLFVWDKINNVEQK
jgi:hypothetical protein